MKLQSGPGSKKRISWKEAIMRCYDFDYDGHRDWRLPTSKELQEIYKESKKDYRWYWSCDSCTPDTSFALVVRFRNSIIHADKKINTNYVMPVRGKSRREFEQLAKKLIEESI